MHTGLSIRLLYSTTTELLYLSAFILRDFDSGFLTAPIIALDFLKIFNTVDHELLKFHHHDLSFSVLSLLRSFLVKCSQHVSSSISFFSSRSFRSPPRSVLAPLLFILFISGLPSTLVTITFLMYADIIFLSSFAPP